MRRKCLNSPWANQSFQMIFQILYFADSCFVVANSCKHGQTLLQAANFLRDSLSVTAGKNLQSGGKHKQLKETLEAWLCWKNYAQNKIWESQYYEVIQ